MEIEASWVKVQHVSFGYDLEGDGACRKIAIWDWIQVKEERVWLFLSRYDEYQAALQLINPNVVSKEATKYLFPLQRIRSIMKQDSNYNPKTEAFTTMSKAT